VFVTTDDKEIARVSGQYGAKIIWRPAELATDGSSSEAAILHAISEIEKKRKISLVVFLQATSPLREATDIDKALEKFISDGADSLFSAAALEDFCVWEVKNSKLRSITFDYKNRGRRQDRKPCYLENGSIYIFKPGIIRRRNNRLGGKIALYLMPFWKSYEIDKAEDIGICKFYMINKIMKYPVPRARGI
jgi:N-acylneuraminate cytidylyltransferase